MTCYTIRSCLKLATLAAISAPFAHTAAHLGLREARIIVEHTPAFVKAESEGLCPQTSDAALNHDIATVVVRGGCKEYSWIGDFYVNILTGAVRMDTAGGPKVIETDELEKLKELLDKRRADARISTAQAMCIAKHSVPKGIRKSCERDVVVAEDEESIRVTVSNTCTEPSHVVLNANIDRYTGTTRDLTTGAALSSARAVAEDMLEANSVPRLTPALTKQLFNSKNAIPMLRQVVPSSACLRTEVSPLSNADEIWLEISSGCGPNPDVATVSINAVTGELRAIQPNKPLSPQATAKLQRMLLDTATARRQQAAEAVRLECR